MTSSIDRDDSSIFDGLIEEDEKDKAKRVSRNKSEKIRRDQFNVLIKELGTMLPGNTCKMDKSTILQKSIDFLHKHKEIAAQSESTEIRQDWKPPFLSNEEFTQLMLEALDGFFLAIMTDGNIIYVSENVTSLLEHLPSDLVDQNLLNFLPMGEHSEVYRALSAQVREGEMLTPDYLKTRNQLEFCCHMLRGTIDPKEPPVYEYVRFIGNFKSLKKVPNCTGNGFDGVIQRSLHSAFEDKVCLVATVRLAKPQFIKEMCTVEEPNEEFTSRHSLEWKFLFLDHRAPPIIGYLPFEVLGTSGYDYYHVDDLETLAKCHEHLMQYGKGKSCYYRFLTKGQQWIWLQTHYYITYHQWNSRPEFIVCTHTVVSYAEVRAEQRRELGIQESPPEIAVDKSQGSGSESQLNASSLKEALERFNRSRTPSASSRSSRKSSHTAVSDPASSQMKIQGDRSTPGRQSVSAVEMTSQRRSSVSSQVSGRVGASLHLADISLFTMFLFCVCTSEQPVQYSGQLTAMQNLKEKLEERARTIETNIQRQQDELRQIQDQLQRVQGHSVQVRACQHVFCCFVFFCLDSPLSENMVHSRCLRSRTRVPNFWLYDFSFSTVSTLMPQSQQTPLPGSLYNTMMIPQQNPANVVQISTTLAQNSRPCAPAVATFAQDHSAQIRFPAGPQLLTKLVTGQMACGAVMVPTTMFMGQVVTAFAPQQGQTQAINISQQQQQEAQSQLSAMQAGQAPLKIILNAPRLLHGNQSTQLILQAAFPLQQHSAFAAAAQQQKPQRQQQLAPLRSDGLSDRSSSQPQ
uniref:Circadian locomoter output cycles protein kaput n=1 Tax=Nothobranchius furzeri TaxID=105023 RepID=A0A8C6MKY6_NOTFU